MPLGMGLDLDRVCNRLRLTHDSLRLKVCKSFVTKRRLIKNYKIQVFLYFLTGIFKRINRLASLNHSASYTEKPHAPLAALCLNNRLNLGTLVVLFHEVPTKSFASTLPFRHIATSTSSFFPSVTFIIF